ncbi:hypothetical protein DRI50_09480 [candidate division KSB1 bacterium]|nr:MAG: hypothetical protein DRI50_09480 [candidate division KSB1 bacterium]
MQEKEIIKKLVELYPNHVLPIEKLPRAYCPGGASHVKAIYLGCDPSNVHSTELPYVFAHECNLNIFNAFIKAHTEQLQHIGLDWHSVYAQNFCQNYFKKETSKNPIWKKAAQEFWIDHLVDELEQFDNSVPVLLTSQYLLQVLGTDGYENIPAKEFYECIQSIPIPADKNKLNRALIPVYRGRNPNLGVSYHLKNDKWKMYRESIKGFITNR